MRITPYYESKGIKNPYYVLSPTVVNGVVRELKKQGEGYKNIKSTDILFRNVEPNQLNGSIIYRATSSSSKIFQITNKQKEDLPFISPCIALALFKPMFISLSGVSSSSSKSAS